MVCNWQSVWSSLTPMCLRVVCNPPVAASVRQVAAADADVERSNAARQSESQRMLDAIKGRTSDYGAQQVPSRPGTP